MEDLNQREKKSFMDTKWWAILTLIGIWPVGLYYVWRNQEFSRTTKKVLTAIVLLFVAIFIGLQVLTMKIETTNAEKKQIQAEQIEDSKAYKREFPEDPNRMDYGPGTYQVGVDIPAGTYFIFNPGKIDITTDLSGEPDAVVDSQLHFGYNGYLSVYEGEYLTLKDCTITALDQAPPYEEDFYGNAMLLVGRDLPAGDYTLAPIIETMRSSYEINAAPIGRNSKIIELEKLENEEKTITLRDGEYLTLSNTHIVLEK